VILNLPNKLKQNWGVSMLFW